LVEISHIRSSWDFDGGIVERNRSSAEIYGYCREEALGKRKEQLLSTGVPSCSFEGLRAKLLQTATGQASSGADPRAARR
jgi:two-component system CheB/CheR fusion protein